jgi:hypothetical protein
LYYVGADGRVLRNSARGSRSLSWSWNYGFTTVQARQTYRKLYCSESKLELYVLEEKMFCKSCTRGILDVDAHAYQSHLLASSLFMVIFPSYYPPLHQRCWNSVVNKLKEIDVFEVGSRT